MEVIKNLQPALPYSYNDFKDRKTLVQEPDFIPKSDEDRLIVKPNDFGYGYKTESFDPYFCKTITRLQFNETVKHCTYLCGITWRDYLRDERKNENWFVDILLKICVVLLAIGFFLFMYVIHIDNEQKDLGFNVGYFFGVFCLLVSIGVGVKVMFSKPRFETYEALLISSLGNYLNDQTLAVYNQKGFQWYLGEKALWMELWNNDRTWKKMVGEDGKMNKDQVVKKDRNGYPVPDNNMINVGSR